MSGFQTKKIITQLTLGETFSSARRGFGKTIEEVSRATLIAPRYLEVLERSDYEKLPSDMYCRCFIRAYSQYLELNPEEMLQQYIHEKNILKNIKNKKFHEATKPIPKVSFWHFLVPPKIVRAVVIVIIATICLTYLGFKVEAITRPPDLVIENPLDNLLTRDKTIKITGKTNVEVIIAINNEKVTLDEEGRFSEDLDLHPGLNIIKITAKKNHSRENVIERRVLYEEDSKK